MSFPSTGAEVACMYVGAAGAGLHVQALARPPVWSQVLASGATTTQAAPNYDGSVGTPSFQVRAFQDGYVSIGPTPNASTAPRLPIGAGETLNVFCASGDKLAFLAAA